MFGVAGESFVDNWLSFIVIVPIVVVLVLIASKIAKMKTGKHIGNFLHKLLLVVTYPFYKIRSALPQRGQSMFDNFFYILYCIGAILLIKYGAN